MKKFILLLAFLCYKNIHAQNNPFMNDGNGRPLYIKTTYVADGSPYLFDEYNFAEITSVSGIVYRQVRVKLNMVDNQVQYMSDKGEELVANLLIRKVKFLSAVDEDQKHVEITVESFGEALNSSGSVIYQVIDSGKVMLLKKTAITTRDEKKYGEATITRHFEKVQSDYLFINHEMKKIEKGKSFFLDTLIDKRKEVEAFIDQNKLKCKSKDDYKKIIAYYNSL
ncbi:MAG: hypothetical protein ABI480_17415 [Chitinophagaceae bacterium]